MATRAKAFVFKDTAPVAKPTRTTRKTAVVVDFPVVKAPAGIKAKIDELAILRKQIAELKAREDVLKAAVVAKLQNRESISGYEYVVSMQTYDMNTISKEKVAKLLTPAQLARCTNTVHIEKLVFASKE